MSTLNDLSDESSVDADSRLEFIKSYDIAKEAVRRFLRANNIKADTDPNRFTATVVDELSSDQLTDLVCAYKYAKSGSTNYYELSGLDSESFKSIERTVKKHFNRDDDAAPRYSVEQCEEIRGNLYLTFSYTDFVGHTDPKTMQTRSKGVSKAVPVVFYRNKEVYEVRTSNDKVAKGITTGIRDSFGQKETMSGRIRIGDLIKDDLESQHVERFSSVKLRLRENDDETVRDVSATSGRSSGVREDVREDSEYEKLVQNRGGTVISGYAVLDVGGFEREIRLQLNWKDHRVSFQTVEMEQVYNEVLEIIYELVKENRGGTREGSETIRKFT
ncbi:hypothetical protein [Halobaculum sp. MBLA0143]|uniref:hypothetical protein n=1 Tax=Halobaculum sp. MBLA0143 TaxID=3079933 RepID=UPI0035235CBB